MHMTQDVPGMSHNSASHPDARSAPLGHHRRARKKNTAILSFRRSKGPRIGRFRDRRQNRGYPQLEKEGKEGYCLLDSEFCGGDALLCYIWASLVLQAVKNMPAMWETQVRSLGREDPLEKGMATHSSILVWGIQQRSLAGYSLLGHKESDTTEQLTLSLLFMLCIFHHNQKKKTHAAALNREDKLQ